MKKKIKFYCQKVSSVYFANMLSGILLFLIPCSYIFGPAVTEFFLFVSIIYFLTLSPVKIKNVYKNPSIIFLLIFSLYICVNSYFQITGPLSKNLQLSSLVHFRYILFAISIIYICKNLENFKKNYFFFILIFFLLILINDSFIQFLTGSNIIGFELANHYRVSSFFKDELILGSFLVRLLPIVMWSIFFFNIDVGKFFFLLTLFLSTCFIAIYLSGERTSLFLCLVLVILSLIILKKLRTILIISVIISITSMFLITHFKIGSYDPYNRIFTKTFKQITKKRENSNFNDSLKVKNSNQLFKVEKFLQNSRLFSKDHEGHIVLALELFYQNKIFGMGPKGFRYYCRKVDYNPSVGICTTHPHNILIQIISELGLIGLLFYIIAVFFVLFNFTKFFLKENNRNEHFAFYSITLGIVLNLFPFLPSGNFFNNWISIILYYNIGIYLYSYSKVNR